MKAPQARHVLGRDDELAEIDRFIGAIAAGPRALVLEGTAGIGKTTLWQAGLDASHAAGFLVLSTRAAESEATLSYSALGDLFQGVGDETLNELPARNAARWIRRCCGSAPRAIWIGTRSHSHRWGWSER